MLGWRGAQVHLGLLASASQTGRFQHLRYHWVATTDATAASAKGARTTNPASTRWSAHPELVEQDAVAWMPEDVPRPRRDRGDDPAVGEGDQGSGSRGTAIGLLP